MQLDLVNLPQEHEIAPISALIDIADHSIEARDALLGYLEFAPKRLGRNKWASRLLESLEPHLHPVKIVVFSLAVGLVAAFIDPSMIEKALRATFILLASLVAYVRWSRIERTRNVEDAMRRKDKTNKIIIINPDILYPYIRKALGDPLAVEARYAVKRPGNEELVKIKMFIFSEIDNLEYVFEKSIAGLIEADYVLRAIKIFVARSENEPFASLARELIVAGKYNELFTRAVWMLIYVAHFRRLRVT